MFRKKTDLRKLPKDILILLLQTIEQDTKKYYENELKELSFLRRYSGKFHKCSFPKCEAKGLLFRNGGKITEGCKSMDICECGKYYCDNHKYHVCNSLLVVPHESEPNMYKDINNGFIIKHNDDRSFDVISIEENGKRRPLTNNEKEKLCLLD